MSTTLHFIDVGQGNMVLLRLANGTIFLYDCNVTDENENRVLQYLADQLGWGIAINVFVCSHRDADHMRGIKKVHANFPIQTIWDTGVVGTSPDSSEYKDYMSLRREVGFKEVEMLKRYDYGNTRLRIMNSKNDDLPNDPNAQSIVIKVVHRDAREDRDLASVMLTGDTDTQAWKMIQKHYDDDDLSCSLLLGSHHGSITYFDDPSDEHKYYTAHIRAKAPTMVIISVGDNNHGHPDEKALELYEKYSSGSNNGNKILRTDVHGTIKAELKNDGGWSVSKNCK